MIELVVIGEKFYKESQSTMSAIYREVPKGTFYRYDWGFLHLDIIAGKEIHIRPAAPKELRFFEEKLNENLVKLGYQSEQNARIVEQKDFFEFILPEIGKPLVMQQ